MDGAQLWRVLVKICDTIHVHTNRHLLFAKFSDHLFGHTTHQLVQFQILHCQVLEQNFREDSCGDSNLG